MNLIRLKICGFGPHSETEIDFSKIGKLAVIHGPTGTGKTTAIQSAFACLYGKFPDHGSIKDGLTANGNGHGSIVLEFGFAGKLWKAERSITPSRHDANLVEIGSEGGIIRSVAGPKVRDFEAAVVALIGSEQLALSTWFCTRDGAGDLVTAIPSERRRVFGEMLDFDSFLRDSKTFGDFANTAEAKAELLEAQLAGAIDHAAAIEVATTQATFSEARRRDLREELGRFEARIRNTEQAIRDAAGDDEPLRAKIREFETGRTGLVGIESRLHKLGAEVEELSRRAGGLCDAKRATERVSVLEIELGNARREQEAFAAWHQWGLDRSGIDAQIASMESSLAAIRSAVSVSGETRALAGSFLSIEDEYRATVAANKVVEGQNESNRRDRARLESEMAQAAAQIQRLQRRLDSRPKTPGAPDVCETCPLLREFAGVPAEIESLRRQIECAGNKLARVSADIAPVDVSLLIARGEKARAAASEVKRAEENSAAIAAMSKRLEGKRAELARHIEAKPAAAEDMRTGIARIETELSGLRPVATRLESCKIAASDHLAKSADLARLEAERKDAEANVELLKAIAETARETIAERESTTRQLRKDLEAAKGEIPRINAEISACDAAIGAAKERIDAAMRAIEADEKKREEARALRLRVSDLRALRDCFGPKGFQPILIDQMIPQLDQIADEVLSRMSCGRLRMRWTTQKARKDGSIGEDLFILIRDERGERDASTASGGERQLIMAANRIALIRWIAATRGNAPRTMIFDEAGNNTDDDATAAFLEELARVSEQFDSILLVTPKAAVAEAVRSRIELSPRFGGVDVAYRQ